MAPPYAKRNTHQPVTRLRSGYRCSVVRLRLLDKKKAAISSVFALTFGTVVMFCTDGLAAVGRPIEPVSLPVLGEGVDVFFLMLMSVLLAVAASTIVLAVRGNQLGRK